MHSYQFKKERLLVITIFLNVAFLSGLLFNINYNNTGLFYTSAVSLQLTVHPAPAGPRLPWPQKNLPPGPGISSPGGSFVFPSFALVSSDDGPFQIVREAVETETGAKLIETVEPSEETGADVVQILEEIKTITDTIGQQLPTTTQPRPSVATTPLIHDSFPTQTREPAISTGAILRETQYGPYDVYGPFSPSLVASPSFTELITPEINVVNITLLNAVAVSWIFYFGNYPPSLTRRLLELLSRIRPHR